MATNGFVTELDVVDFPHSPDSDYEELPFPDFDHHEGDSGFPDSSRLPYTKVYNSALGFSQVHRDVYIPGKPVEARITSVDRNTSGNILSPHVYTVELSHGDFEWVIKRRYVQFLNLHRHLQTYRAALKLPLPTKTHRERKRSFREVARKVQQLPKFPIKPENQIFTGAPTETGEDHLGRRAKQLEKYLNAILGFSMFRNHVEALTFLEVSHLSFVGDLGCKRKEGMVQKRAGGERVAVGIREAICIPLRGMCTSWLDRWLLLKDTFLAVIRPKDGLIREVILMDSRFQIEIGFQKTGRRSGITILNQTRKLTVSGPSRERTDEWLMDINLVIRTTGKDFVEPCRFKSFAPVRNDTLAQWFVDGVGYFEAIANALELAKEEIFITDWMLSPELVLKRPIVEGDRWRLDKILQRKAEQGVKVFVMLYKEVELALAINSDYTRRKLLDLHSENIKVLRHPDHVSTGVMLWAHHEKIIVVDQVYAFLGGLDLCFGRWDDYQHRLVDLGVSGPNASPVSPGAGFVRSSFTVANLTNALQNVAFSPLLDLTGDMQINNSHNLRNGILQPQSPGILVDQKLWPGKDYMNFIYKDFSELDSPFVDLVDRRKVPRMPWHDIGMVMQGKTARDVARHFIQRWNAAKAEKMKENFYYPLLMPKSYDNLDDVSKLLSRMRPVSCQVLRSASRWSAGLTDTDHSIQTAYIRIIMEAKHFVYIENQFFVSLTGANAYVSNKIAEAIFHRIIRAHKRKETFRVYVIMPLLPAFEGELGTNSGVALQAVTHWNFASICRGAFSLYGRLAKEVGDVTSYLTFYGLRTFDEGNGRPVSELVYVHSKMIIVDDRIAIIGSANINDRSMNGDRDSEIAAIVEDTEMYDSRMAGKPFSAGRFVGSLRRHLFREHLGLIDKPREDFDISDPVSEKFFKDVWLRTASKNTAIFEKVFCCVPNDRIHTFAQLRQFTKETPMAESNWEEAQAKLRELQGHLVLMPLHFLCDESLVPPPGSKEALMPTALWT